MVVIVFLLVVIRIAPTAASAAVAVAVVPVVMAVIAVAVLVLIAVRRPFIRLERPALLLLPEIIAERRPVSRSILILLMLLGLLLLLILENRVEFLFQKPEMLPDPFQLRLHVGFDRGGCRNFRFNDGRGVLLGRFFFGFSFRGAGFFRGHFFFPLVG
jgi:hypothetical protein